MNELLASSSAQTEQVNIILLMGIAIFAARRSYVVNRDALRQAQGKLRSISRVDSKSSIAPWCISYLKG